MASAHPAPDSDNRTACPNCGQMQPNDAPGHSTGCVIGGLLTTLEDRGFDFANAKGTIHDIDADAIWEITLGPLADEIERRLEVGER